MTTLALPAATVVLGGRNAGVLLPAAETAVGSNAGFSIPNNGRTLIRIVMGASGAGNLSLVLQRTVEGQVPPPFVVALANSGQYFFGPFSQTDFNDANGLLQCLMSVATGNSVGGYLLDQGLT